VLYSVIGGAFLFSGGLYIILSLGFLYLLARCGFFFLFLLFCFMPEMLGGY